MKTNTRQSNKREVKKYFSGKWSINFFNMITLIKFSFLRVRSASMKSILLGPDIIFNNVPLMF